MITTDYKIKVTAEQSKIVQEICFNHGIEWRTGAKRIMFVDEIPFTKKYLLINPTTKGITYLSSKDDYYKSSNQLINAHEFIRMYSDTGSYTERINKDIKTFELIRCDYKDEFYERINDISEECQGRIEVDYKPIIGESNKIVYTALVTILPDEDRNI